MTPYSAARFLTGNRRVVFMSSCSFWLDHVVVPDGRASGGKSSHAFEADRLRTNSRACHTPRFLRAFDRYEVVAMPEAHGMKDINDFILSLIRDAAFPVKGNDIAVECGNSLYQPALDPDQLHFGQTMRVLIAQYV